MEERVRRLMRSVGTNPAAWHEPRLPFYSSVLGRSVRSTEIDADYWIAAACATLRFDRAVATALGDGYRAFLEVSPSAVLTGDAREVIRDEGGKAVAIATLRKGIEDGRALALTAADLHEAGCIEDLASFSAGGGRQVQLPTYAWDRSSFWWPALDTHASDTPKRVPPDASPSTAVAEEKVYRLKWSAEAARARTTGIDIDALDAKCAERSARTDLDAYAARESEIDKICAIFACRALADLGVSDAEVFTIESLARAHSLGERQRRLLTWLCHMAEADGLVTTTGGRSKIGGSLPSADVDEALATLASDLPGARHELTLLRRCGPRIADVLRGSVDALTLIFPDGNAAAAAAIFSESGISNVTNALVADVVDAFVCQRDRTAPLRVLEIGAGTGGTTKALRALLDQDGIAYCCTDISTSLLRQTAQQFVDWSGFEARRLDIARDPLTQGFDVASYDLIICANVLHATQDIAAALAHTRKLLAPAGAVLLLEATSPQRIIDLTFGLTKDWWNFVDVGLRPGHPLLSRTAWLGQLSVAGLDDCAALPGNADDAANLGSTVFFARASELNHASAMHAERFLLLGPRDDICQAVIAELEQGGAVVEVLEHISSNNFESFEPLRGIIDLRCLYLEFDERRGGSTLLSGAELLFKSLFELTAILAARPSMAAKLVFLTRGAIVTSDDDSPPDPLQAAFRAAIATLSDEHPSWSIAAIDCAPAAPTLVAEAVRQVLIGSERVSFAAWRGCKRWRPALERVPELGGDGEKNGIDPDKVHVVTGGLGALGLDICEWLAHRGARYLVLAQRRAHHGDAAGRIEALRRASVKIDIAPVDLAKPDDAAAFAADLARGNRPVCGITYAAGAFDDALILNQDWSRFSRVLGAKAVGAWELHRAFAARELDYVLYCSSVAGILGPAGLSNYVAANAFLSALAERARRQGVPATCIAWGGWSGLGMAARQSERWLERWRARGIEGLDRDDIWRMLNWAVSGHAPADVLIMDVAWDQCTNHLPQASRPMVAALTPNPREAGRAPFDPITPSDRLDIGAIADPLLRRERIRSEVRQRCLTALELPPHFNLELNISLADLGLDSLLALELRAEFCTVFGLDLPQTLLFDCPSAEAITAHLVSACERSSADSVAREGIG
jgi:NAD(P)-dependent dehydrogenase (short-subunit alcohol dehydrogenase family)/SAM-dependent methyltransferase/acyl carrier protein